MILSVAARDYKEDIFHAELSLYYYIVLYRWTIAYILQLTGKHYAKKYFYILHFIVKSVPSFIIITSIESVLLKNSNYLFKTLQLQDLVIQLNRISYFSMILRMYNHKYVDRFSIPVCIVIQIACVSEYFLCKFCGTNYYSNSIFKLVRKY